MYASSLFKLYASNFVNQFVIALKDDYRVCDQFGRALLDW